MAEVIFEHQPGPFVAEYPHWYVVRQPEGCTDPMVVRFLKVGKNGKLLDQTARWTVSRPYAGAVLQVRWDSSRWTPAPPRVPKWLLERVVTHMLTVEVQP